MHKFDPAKADALLDEDRQKHLPSDEILDRLPLSPSQEVADIGCGPGYFTIPLAERVPGGTVYALDTEEAMLERCRERVEEAGLSNVEVVRSTEDSLPLAPASMDGMLLAFVLHEAAEDRAAFLELLARHTRPGGWLAIVEWRRVESPYGPPQEIRLEPDDVRALLSSTSWTPEGASEPIGEWFHFTLARRNP